MGKKERVGRAVIPQWWLDKVLPRLDASVTTDAEIAHQASVIARRQSPWGPSAISKFRSGAAGRSIELTNALSVVLQVPQPFLTAPTEAAAIDMAQIVKRELAHLVELRQQLSVIDRVAARETDAAGLDRRDAIGVVSAPNGAAVGSRERVGRTRRGR